MDAAVWQSGEWRDVRVDVPAHAVSRDFADQAVVLNVRSGAYHGLKGSGGAVFAALQAEATLGAAVARLCAQFDCSEADILPRVATFVDSLEDRELVALAPPGDG